MRNLLIVALSLGGCASEQSTLNHRSELAVQARGLALYEDGESGHAGMWGTTCEFESYGGNTTGDFDYPGEQDRVVDASSTTIGTMSAIVRTPGGFYITRPYDFPDRVRIPLSGILDARHVMGGVAALRNAGVSNCMVSWYDLDEGLNSTSLPSELCDAQRTVIEVDKVSGLVAIGGDQGAIVIDDEVVHVDGLGDLIAVDAHAEMIYTAESGSDLLSGYKFDGSLVWSVQIEGMIVSLDDMGPELSAAVMVQAFDGSGDLIIVDGFSGVIETTVETPTAARQIEVSDNGSVMAMVLMDSIHFFDLNTP
jgi:hypothetical protein